MSLEGTNDDPRDLRLGQTWTSRQRLKNGLIYVAARVTLAVITPLPAGVLRAAGRALGRALHTFLSGPRRLARANVARAIPELSPADRHALVQRSFVSLGGYLGEAVSSLSGRAAVLPFADGSLEALRQARQCGRGVLLVSAHLGPWEQVASSLVAAGVPLTVVAREAYDPRFAWIYDRMRTRRGVRSILRGSRGGSRQMEATLLAGEVLGIVMDLRSRVPSITVPLLGIACETPVGPARLALKTGACVVVGTVAERSGTLCIEIGRLETGDLVRGADGESTLTTRINDELSARIRRLPEAWVWMHPRWPPNG